MKNKKEIILKYDVYGDESGYIESFETLEEAIKFIKELKSFDKRNNIKDNYYIEENEK